MKLFLLCAAICFLGVESSILPDRLRRNICKKSDPNYQACFQQAMQSDRSDFMKGIPELGYGGFEPLITKSLNVSKNLGFMASINGNMQNIAVTGFSNATIQTLRVDPNKLNGEITFVLPSTLLSTDMQISGSIIFIPINIIGNFQGLFGPVTIEMNFQLSKYLKNGQWYFSLDKTNTILQIGAGKVYIKAKDPGAQGGADFISNFYNSNQVMVTGAIYPVLQDLVTQIIQDKISCYLAMVPAAELLPE